MLTTPTFEHALAWLRAHELAVPPGLDPRLARNQEASRRRAQIMKATFSSPNGQLALQTILDASLFRSPIDATLPRDGTYENHLLLREGQNQLAATILAYLDMAEEYERTPRDEPADEFFGASRGGPGGSDGRDGGPDGGGDGDEDFVAIR